MTKTLDIAGRIATGLGLTASLLVWLLMLPLCAAAFVLISAFGPPVTSQAR